MKRVIWIAVAILVMLGIMGFGLHTLNNIEEVNKRRREKEKGEILASHIAMTTATTSVWDILRQTTDDTSSGSPDDQPAPQPQEDEAPSTQPADEENAVPEVITDAPVSEPTVTTGIIIKMN